MLLLENVCFVLEVRTTSHESVSAIFITSSLPVNASYQLSLFSSASATILVAAFAEITKGAEWPSRGILASGRGGLDVFTAYSKRYCCNLYPKRLVQLGARYSICAWSSATWCIQHGSISSIMISVIPICSICSLCTLCMSSSLHFPPCPAFQGGSCSSWCVGRGSIFFIWPSLHVCILTLHLKRHCFVDHLLHFQHITNLMSLYHYLIHILCFAVSLLQQLWYKQESSSSCQFSPFPCRL